jgi:hypothetical protein
LPQLKHFQWYVVAEAGHVTQSFRPQPGQEMRVRSVAPLGAWVGCSDMRRLLEVECAANGGGV